MTEPKRVGNNGAAALLGVKPATWRKDVSSARPGSAPAPDGREEISGSPWWYESTVLAYRDARPGKGTRPGLGRRAAEIVKPWPLCDCDRPTCESLWQHDRSCAVAHRVRSPAPVPD